MHQVSKQNTHTHCGTIQYISTLYSSLNGYDIYTAIYEGTEPKLHESWHLCKGLNMSIHKFHAQNNKIDLHVGSKYTIHVHDYTAV